MMSLTMICTLIFHFHSLRSISMMSETTLPGERCVFLSLAFQSTSLRDGFSAIDMERCFSSCQSGLVFAIVIFSRTNSGFGLPIPNGLNASICSSVSILMAS